MISYIGAFIQSGCTVEGIKEGKIALAKVFPFSAIVEEEPKEEDHDNKLLYENTVTDFLWRLKKTIIDTNGDFKVIIGGDHSLGIGSVSANYEDDMMLIWVDAHGDFNSDKTTITGRIHGMPVATLAGHSSAKLLELCENNYLKPENIVYFGTRDLDPDEEKLMKECGVKVFGMRHIKENGADSAIKDVLSYVGNKRLYISLDLDSMDPKLVPGVSIPVVDGLSPEDVYCLLDALFNNVDIIGMDLVEYNPRFDRNDMTLEVIKDIKKLIEKYK